MRAILTRDWVELSFPVLGKHPPTGENGGYKRHLSSPGFHRRGDQGWSAPQIQGTGCSGCQSFPFLLLFMLLHICFSKKMLPVSVEKSTLHVSHKVSPCQSHLVYVSLTLCPAQMCHLPKALQIVYLIGSTSLRNEILWAAGWGGPSHWEVSQSWRTRLL